jgi:hypothetical protein
MSSARRHASNARHNTARLCQEKPQEAVNGHAPRPTHTTTLHRSRKPRKALSISPIANDNPELPVGSSEPATIPHCTSASRLVCPHRLHTACAVATEAEGRSARGTEASLVFRFRAFAGCFCPLFFSLVAPSQLLTCLMRVVEGFDVKSSPQIVQE